MQVHNDLKTKNILLSSSFDVAKIGAHPACPCHLACPLRVTLQEYRSLQTDHPTRVEPVTPVLLQQVPRNDDFDRGNRICLRQGMWGWRASWRPLTWQPGLAPCGTFAYAAPEMLMGTRCSEKVGAPVWHTLTIFKAMRMVFM